MRPLPCGWAPVGLSSVQVAYTSPCVRPPVLSALQLQSGHCSSSCKFTFHCRSIRVLFGPPGLPPNPPASCRLLGPFLVRLLFGLFSSSSRAPTLPAFFVDSTFFLSGWLPAFFQLKGRGVL
jgi:hypothetical protein